MHRLRTQDNWNTVAETLDQNNEKENSAQEDKYKMYCFKKW